MKTEFYDWNASNFMIEMHGLTFQLIWNNISPAHILNINDSQFQKKKMSISKYNIYDDISIEIDVSCQSREKVK